MTRDEVVKKHEDYLFPCVTHYYTNPLVADRGFMQYIWAQRAIVTLTSSAASSPSA
jgi:hypothetical protein